MAGKSNAETVAKMASEIVSQDVTPTASPTATISRGTIQQMTFEERVVAVQTEVSVGKDLYNSFGGYAYRSAETILAVAKPICAKYGLLLTLTDRLEHTGDRYYIAATAYLQDAQAPKTDENGYRNSADSIAVTSYAREPEAKKGMDESQITGSASSYARKYALAGLLGLHGEDDADATNTHGKDATPQPATASSFGGSMPKPKTQITFGSKVQGENF